MSVADDIAERWSIFSKAQDIVDSKFNDQRTLADEAWADAESLMNQINAFAKSLKVTQINIDDILPNLDISDIADFTGNEPNAANYDVTYHPPTKDLPTDLIEALENKLLTDITNPSPAISQAVEDLIFARDTERAELQLQDALDDVAAEWSKRGFTLPDANLMAALTVVRTEYLNKRLDVSRDIGIKNFELSDTNMKFAEDLAEKHIITMITVYKAEIDAEIARMEAVVKSFLAAVEIYKGEFEVYKAKWEFWYKKYEYELKQNIARGEIALKNAEINLVNYREIQGIELKALDSMATVNSHIVAGAFSGVSAQAQITAANSADYKYSTDPSY